MAACRSSGHLPASAAVATRGRDLSTSSINSGANRVVSGGNLTQWTDVSSGIVCTVPGGQTGFPTTATTFQQYDGQTLTAGTQELSNTAATAMCTAEPRRARWSASAALADAGAGLSVAFASSTGTTKKAHFYMGANVCYSDSAINTVGADAVLWLAMRRCVHDHPQRGQHTATLHERLAGHRRQRHGCSSDRAGCRWRRGRLPALPCWMT